MSNAPQDRKEGKGEEVDVLDTYCVFPAESKSETPEGQKSDADVPEFISIEGEKEDPNKVIDEALVRENETGGRGPYVWPHSADVYTGHEEEEEELKEQTEEQEKQR
ncbi:hypothetical protein GGS21DRAFT_485915 [Xylaria nigripes]|nr:hypothetical protein GGS21DRAFT_485915 [Xylaria nigripes]